VPVVIARYDTMITISEAIELLNYIDIDADVRAKTTRELQLTGSLHAFWRVIRGNFDLQHSKDYKGILQNLRNMKEYIEENKTEYFGTSK